MPPSVYAVYEQRYAELRKQTFAAEVLLMETLFQEERVEKPDDWDTLLPKEDD